MTLSSGLRNILLVTHRWLGLSSAAVLAIAGATGVLLAWPWWLTEEPLVRWVAARVHESLGLGLLGVGYVGYWAVTIATGAGLLLLAGGLVLWWRRKIASVRVHRGWRLGTFDLHHAVGIAGFAFMLLIVVTGLCVSFLRPDTGMLFEIAFALHTTRGFPWPVKLVYVLGSLAFTVQVVTGVVMWWKPIAGLPRGTVAGALTGGEIRAGAAGSREPRLAANQARQGS